MSSSVSLASHLPMPEILSGKLPPADYSQCPFWFWNDNLDEVEIRRQMAGFQAHGVEAFVIHPRIGLPNSIDWLSPELFRFMRIAVEEARRLGMWVVLYDEGMYPSGSSAGQVVATNSAFHARCLSCSTHELSAEEIGAKTLGGKDKESAMDKDIRLLARVTRANGEPLWIYDRKVDSVVRGLHYMSDETHPWPAEEEPPAADLLNPEAVLCLRRLVYDRFYAELGDHFGTTIKAIFTDEPHPLGRCREQKVMPGTSDILTHVQRILGYDFTPHLPALWFDDEPNAEEYRRQYNEAIAVRMGETYYEPLSEWCARHGIALTGHPAEPTDLGHLKYLHIPGQDIVWRHVEPHKPSALEGPPSTMAKAAASSAFHRGRARNMNEFAGAFGHELTFTELKWLASWLLIRGCDLLMPHAFYYSVRGIRRDERPPDVGPNSAWWDDYRPWADATRRLCHINATHAPVCEVAILGRSTELPWEAARTLLQHQIDFHYIEPEDLMSLTESLSGSGEKKAGWNEAERRLHIGPGRYTTVIEEKNFDHPAMDCFSMDLSLENPDSNAPTPGIPWSDTGWSRVQKRVRPVVTLDSPAPDLRARYVVSRGSSYINETSASPVRPTHVVMLFNEGADSLTRRITLPPEFYSASTHAVHQLDIYTGESTLWTGERPLTLEPHGWAVFVC